MGDRDAMAEALAVQALTLVGELWAEWEPDDADQIRVGLLDKRVSALLFEEHPCVQCRWAWKYNGVACAEHRQDTPRWDTRSDQGEKS